MGSELRMDADTSDFKKILGRWDSVAIIIAIVIGVGIFRVPAEVARYLKSPNLILLAWLLGGVIALLGALCYAELSASYPKTGGNYIYLRESYGIWAGFLFGWIELLVIRTGSIAAVSFICAEYLQSFFSLSNSFLIKPIAISVILALSFINIFGLQYGKRTQNLFTITKISCLVGIILFGVMSQKGDILHFYSGPTAMDRGIFATFGLALIPILWTYGGWHENTFVAEETKDATRIIPGALIIGVFVVTSLYLAINFLYLYLIPAAEMVNARLIGSDVLNILCGEAGRKIFETIVIISSLASINVMIITGSRVTYAMAKDNAIFKYIGKINTKYATPHRAIVINALWSIALVLLGTFNKLLFFTGAVVWLFFALVTGGLFVFPSLHLWAYCYWQAAFRCALFRKRGRISTLTDYKNRDESGKMACFYGIGKYNPKG